MTPAKRFMTRALRRRPTKTTAAASVPRRPGGSQLSAAAIWLVPAVVAAVLSAPRIGLGYFWDDYDFINLRGTGDWSTYFRLDPSITFYRPIPQGVYALVLRLVDPHSGHVGHAVNLVLLAACVALFARWVRKVADPWTGFLAGLAFALLGAAPSLATWVSGSADLFAMLFLFLALSLRHDGRIWPAAGWASLALLSKESAIAAFPALIAYDLVIGREPKNLRRSLIAFGAVALAWAAIHPGLHRLFAHGLRAGSTHYVGLAHSERWGTHFVRYVLTLANIPLTGLRTPWPTDLSVAATIALGLLLAGFLIAGRGTPSGRRGRGPEAAPTRRLVALALVLALPALALPTLFVQLWVPYFAVIVAPGTCLLIALALRQVPTAASALALAAFLLIGVWSRAMTLPDESVWSEPVLVDAARSIETVRRHFLELYPSIPRGAQILVSVAATGSRGISSTLLEGQALDLWYGDPTLHTATPESREAGYRADLLFRVTSGLDVVDIDPVGCRFRSTSRVVDPFDVGRPISTYARAVAAAGDPDLALRVLERLAELDQDAYRSYDVRLAASIALAYGRRTDAERLRASAAPLDRADALTMLGRIFGNPTRNAAQDSCAYWAFEISPDDADAIRHYLSIFRGLGNPTQIEHFARRLQTLAPGDPEAAAALRSLAHP